MNRAKKAMGRFIAATLATAALAFGMAPSSASASSTVNVGGYATCAWLGSGLAASKVTISLDSGGTQSVGTSSAPWSNGLYRMSFPWMPSGGTWATATVTCSSFSFHPGNQSYRIWLKPDWRNTTGDHSFWNV